MTGNVTSINVDGHLYCVVDKGNNRHPQAVEVCRKLNARLPLPKSQNEAEMFIRIGGFAYTNVDARNPKKTDNRKEWIDAEGKPLGNKPVYLGVTKNYVTK